eukprot:SAG31_NODE_18508_length_633_cov_1.327715_2_plen_91_part_00
MTYPLSHSILAKDHCGALVDLANDSLVDGEIVLRHASARYNGTHSTELLTTAIVNDIAAHDVSRPLFACEHKFADLSLYYTRFFPTLNAL